MKESNIINSIDEVKDKMINKITSIIAITLIPILFIMLVKKSFNLFSPLLFLELILISLINIINIFKKTLNTYLKGKIIFIIILLVGLINIHVFGVFSSGIALVICSCVMMAIVFGKKSAFIFLIISILSVMSIGIGISIEIIEIKDEVFETSFPLIAMITRIIALGLFIGVMLLAIGNMHKYLFDTIVTLSEQRQELKKLNQELALRIDAHKKTEFELKESKEKLQTIFDNTNDSIVVIKDNHIQYTNKRFLKIFEYENYENIKNKKTDSILVPEVFEKYCNKNIPDLIEGKGIKKDGSIFDIEIKASFFKLNNENYTVAIMRNITEKKKQEKIISESEERLRSIFDCFEDSICVLKKTKIIFANEAFKKFTMYKNSENLVGKDLIEFIPDFYKEKIKLNIEKKYNGEVMPKSYNIVCPKNKNQSFDFNVRISMLTYVQNNELYIVYVSRDISEFIKVQEELKNHKKNLENLVDERTKELINARKISEAANRSKTEFLTNMSHEIRTPINSVIGYSYMLQRSLMNSKDMEYVKTIRASANHLLDLVSDILSLSKIEANKVSLEEEIFNIEKVFENILSIQKYQALSKGLNFYFDLDENIPKFIKGDVVKLKQILMNLISNAIKFTNKGFVKVFCLLEKKENKKIFLKFCIEDSGIGISEEKKDLLFENFIQGDSSISRNFGGSGLGLSISKSLVELLGGKISIINKKKSGTIICFNIKVTSVENFNESNLNSTKYTDYNFPEFPDFKSKSVLLVEDNYINQKMMKELLSSLNFKVTTANNGRETISFISYKKFDVIIMDLHLPEMDGYELTYIIRNKSNYKKVPIIALTADVIEGTKEKIFSVGMNAYLSKPIEPNKLILTLAQSLGVKIKNTNQNYKNSVNNESNEIISFDRGVKRINGNKKLYLDLLNIFLSEHINDYKKICTLILEKDFHKAENKIHILKGVSSNIGAYRLSEELSDLEKYIKKNRNDSILQKMDLIKNELDCVINSINSYLQKNNSKTTKKIFNYSEENYTHIVKILKNYIRYGDIQSYDYLINNKEIILEKLSKKEYQELEIALSKFEFKTALGILKLFN